MVSVATVVLLVTGWGSAAADNVTSVIVANPTSKPVPVQEVNTDANRNIKVHEQGTANTREQNTDANGNIKVHEQGTAEVHVTNGLTVAAPAPVTSGGGGRVCSTFVSPCDLVVERTASALQINMTSTVDALELLDGPQEQVVAAFLGPDSDAGAAPTVSFALTRPISFNAIACLGNGGQCSVGWVGNSP
jgi:hypothetical protein